MLLLLLLPLLLLRWAVVVDGGGDGGGGVVALSVPLLSFGRFYVLMFLFLGANVFMLVLGAHDSMNFSKNMFDQVVGHSHIDFHGDICDCNWEQMCTA